MKIKNLEHFKSLPGQKPGVNFLGITHPIYDDIPIQFCMGKMIIEPGAISETRRFGVGIVYYTTEGHGSAAINGEKVFLEPNTILYSHPIA